MRDHTTFITRGTRYFHRVTFGFFAGGFATFALLYCVQPLLPLYTKEFRVTPATASLVLSVTTLLLAIMMTFTASLSNAWGRKKMMASSLVLASIITIISAGSPNFLFLLLCRTLEGIALAGVPALAMTYLGEEIAPRDLGAATGIAISGNAIGGMSGRLITSAIADFSSWRLAILCIGLISLFCSWWFWKSLPASVHFRAEAFSLRQHLRGFGQQLKDPGLLFLYGIAFFLMGSFVTLYSYLGYQLAAPPYNLSQTMIGWIFTLYIVGSFGSSWFGRFADRTSRQKALLLSITLMGLGTLLTLCAPLSFKVPGVALVTFGFFGGHTTASSWINQRAGQGKARASALYLFFYYIGSSTGNTAGGFFWAAYGWLGVIEMIGLFVLSALVLAALLSRLEEAARVWR